MIQEAVGSFDTANTGQTVLSTGFQQGLVEKQNFCFEIQEVLSDAQHGMGLCNEQAFGVGGVSKNECAAVNASFLLCQHVPKK